MFMAKHALLFRPVDEMLDRTQVNRKWLLVIVAKEKG
jgi:hypothetical protein